MEVSGAFAANSNRCSTLRTLTACGPGGRGGLAAAPSPALLAPVTLVWLPWMGFLGEGGTAALYDATLPFRRKHRAVQIKVSITHGAGTAAPNLVAAAIPAGTGPDFFESYASPDAFIRQGLLLDLAAYIRKDNLDLAVWPSDAVAFIRESIAAASKTGHGFFTLPVCANITALAVNEGLLDQLRLAYPQPDWTYGQWQGIWEATTQKGGTASGLSRAGYAMFWLSGMGTPVPPPAFLRSFGGEYVAPSNPTRSGLTSSDSRAFWEWVVPLVRSGVIRQFGALTRFNSLGQGHVAVKCWQSASLLDAFDDLSTLKWDWYAMPVGPAGQYIWMSHDGIGVNAGTKQPDLAWEFAKWSTYDPNFDEAIGRISLCTPVQESPMPVPGATEHGGAFVDAGTGVRGHLYGGSGFQHDEVPAMGLVLKVINSAVAGKLSITTALREVTRQVDALERRRAWSPTHECSQRGFAGC